MKNSQNETETVNNINNQMYTGFDNMKRNIGNTKKEI